MEAKGDLLFKQKDGDDDDDDDDHRQHRAHDPQHLRLIPNLGQLFWDLDWVRVGAGRKGHLSGEKQTVFTSVLTTEN